MPTTRCLQTIRSTRRELKSPSRRTRGSRSLGYPAILRLLFILVDCFFGYESYDCCFFYVVHRLFGYVILSDLLDGFALSPSSAMIRWSLRSTSTPTSSEHSRSSSARAFPPPTAFLQVLLSPNLSKIGRELSSLRFICRLSGAVARLYFQLRLSWQERLRHRLRLCGQVPPMCLAWISHALLISKYQILIFSSPKWQYSLLQAFSETPTLMLTLPIASMFSPTNGSPPSPLISSPSTIFISGVMRSQFIGIYLYADAADGGKYRKGVHLELIFPNEPKRDFHSYCGLPFFFVYPILGFFFMSVSIR